MNWIGSEKYGRMPNSGRAASEYGLTSHDRPFRGRYLLST